MMMIKKDYNLSIENFLGGEYEVASYDCCIIQVRRQHKEMRKPTDNTAVTDWLKILTSMLFSFGIFRDTVYNQTFFIRFHIYLAIIIFWLLTALIGGALIGCNVSIIWGALAAVAISMLSYAGFQMVALEYANLRYFHYKQDTNGLWDTSAICEISVMVSKSLFDRLLPFLYFRKQMIFLTRLANCKTSFRDSELRSHKYLECVYF